MPSYRVLFYKASDRMPVVEFLDREIQEDHQAKAYRLLQHLEVTGTNGNPYVEKLRGDIWELRVDFKGVWVRILFCFGPETVIYALHAFKKKTNKTPPGEIDLAQQRADQLLKRG